MKILEAKNITKMFPGVIALDSVDVAFEPGEIHAIIGENGAGKSTLIKCLTGVYEPEEGEVMIGGENAMKNKALFDKVAYVPQEIDLFGYMSVAENLFIPYEKSGVKGTVNQKELEKRAIPILEKFSIPVKPNELVKDISISSQQLLQIARATVHEDYDVLMLDEPTTSLTSRDTKILFNIVEKIKKENKAIIFISHKLEEIFQLADVITVFRNGKKVAYSEIKDVDTNWVIKQMTGRELNQNERFYSTKVSDEVLLEVNNLTGERFTNVSFKLKKGEILGFSGLVGAGRSEVMQAIFGYLPVYKGSVKLDGADWKLGDTNYSVKNGFIYLPEERKKQGILPVLSIRDNISVSVLDNLKSGISISRKKENELAKSVIETYDVKTPGADKEIQFLSGGNQQKVIIGRAMACKQSIGPIPIPFIICLVVLILILFMVKKTKTGRYIYAIGNSKEAAKILGIKVDRIRVMIYSIVGFISALAGLLYVCRLGSAQTAIGEDWPMNSIAASVIGGVALTGGVGNPAGALIGAAVITIIQNIIVLFGVNSYWQSAVSGIVVVLAISFSSISTIVRENRQKRIKLN